MSNDPVKKNMTHKAWETIVALVLWRAGWLHPRGPQGAREPDPSRRLPGAPAWAERIVAMLLGLTPVAALCFVVLLILDPDTQLLGLSLGATLALLAGALVLAGRYLAPQETSVEARPRPADPVAVEQVVQEAHAGLEGITRRRLLGAAAGAAGVGLTAAVVAPLAALGPGIEDQLSRTPWRAGRRLVNKEGTPLLAADMIAGSFLTAFPQAADKENLGSPVVVVRVDPAALRLPVERAGWAPGGILAYSKICTHAACAISLYRSPLSPTTEPRGPALVCPCHYSTFDVLDAGRVEFGPAGRPLPQLPLAIDAAGVLRANGPMSGPVGPSWWGDQQ